MTSSIDHYNKEKYGKINRSRRDGILYFINKKELLVLDIGCNDGTLGEIIKKEKKAIVHGVDISTVAIKKAEKKLDSVHVFDIVGDVDFPVGINDKKYDVIVMSEVLEHLFNPESVLEKIKKISHRETKVIITVPNILFWKSRINILKGNFEYSEEGLMDIGHIHFFSWKV